MREVDLLSLFGRGARTDRQSFLFTGRSEPTDSKPRERIDVLTSRREKQAGLEADLLGAARSLREATSAFRKSTAATRSGGSTFETRIEPVTTTVVTSAEVEVEISPATNAFQASTVFSSRTVNIAGDGSQLRLDLDDGGPSISISVGFEEASLDDLADLINADADNGGRVSASVVAVNDGFRLELETAETGAAAELTIGRDRFEAPVGGVFLDPPITRRYSLIDDSAARDSGSDAVTETQTQDVVETVVEYVEVTEEISTAASIVGSEVAERLEAFVTAYNAVIEGERETGPRNFVGRLFGQVSETLGGARLDVGTEILSRRLDTAEIGKTDLGVSLGPDGSIQLDPDLLETALSTSPDAVLAFLEGGGATGKRTGPDAVELVLARIEQQAGLSRSRF